MAVSSRRKSYTSPKLGTEHQYICWDIDPTGRRLIDEMCNLAAYVPDALFRQYIMPGRDIDFVCRKRHQIRTVNFGRYRVLKETRQNKILKTKSEVYALIDFLDWLALLKGNGEPMILVSYEPLKLAPSLLIEGLKRYNLIGRFKLLVKGFANAYPFIRDKCEKSMNSFSLRILAKVLLNKEHEEIFNAFNRAKLTYEILEHLCAGEVEVDLPPQLKAVLLYFTTVEEEIKVIDELKLSLEKQRTLKPMFSKSLSNPHTRKRAFTLRQLLIVKNIYFTDLSQAWNIDGSDSLEKFLRENINFESNQDKEELVKLIEDYFKETQDERRNGNYKRSTYFRRKSGSNKTVSERTSNPSRTFRMRSSDSLQAVKARTTGVRIDPQKMLQGKESTPQQECNESINEEDWNVIHTSILNMNVSEKRDMNSGNHKVTPVEQSDSSLEKRTDWSEDSSEGDLRKKDLPE